MRRSGFKSKSPTRVGLGLDREQRLEYRAASAMKNVVARPSNMGSTTRVLAPIQKTVAHRNPHLLAMARDQACMLKIQGVCNGDRSTTVAAHSNASQHGKSGARKADDQYHVYACFACHSWLDAGSAPADVKRAAFNKAHAGMIEIWRDIAAGMQHATPKEKAAAQWALDLLFLQDRG